MMSLLSRRLALLLFVVPLPLVSAQDISETAMLAYSQTQPIWKLKAVNSSDPATLLIVKNALNALGGQQNWLGVAGIDTTSTFDSKETVHPEYWHESWTTHTYVRSSSAQANLQASPMTSASLDFISSELPNLTNHYPAAALAMSLRYGCRFSSLSSSPDDTYAVQQYCQQQTDKRFEYSNMIWIFSRATYLPLAVIQARVGNKSYAYHQIVTSYSNYQQFVGIQVPTTISRRLDELHAAIAEHLSNIQVSR